ncbi:ABC transporter substrate-binding protein, partial [Xanthomonas oryzae pv. oryzae]|uniref:twin-arginine translocation signal domain-containing protein n=1 Tax=Xanthomonas oryzae TaxID=347 RepID=UPI0009629A7A
MAKDGISNIDRRTLIKGAGAVGAGLAAGMLGTPAVWGQGKKTLRFLNTETSIDSIRALKVACAESERLTGTPVIVDSVPLDDAFP